MLVFADTPVINSRFRTLIKLITIATEIKGILELSESFKVLRCYHIKAKLKTGKIANVPCQSLKKKIFCLLAALHKSCEAAALPKNIK